MIHPISAIKLAYFALIKFIIIELVELLYNKI